MEPHVCGKVGDAPSENLNPRPEGDHSGRTLRFIWPVKEI